FTGWLKNTNNALRNTAPVYQEACLGDVLLFSTCSQYTGDTYIRLYLNGANVASNDDSVSGYCSAITYTYSAAACGTLVLQLGCYSSGSCSMTATVAVILPPTLAPSPAPTSPAPSPAPTRSPSSRGDTMAPSSSMIRWLSFSVTPPMPDSLCCLMARDSPTFRRLTPSAEAEAGYGPGRALQSTGVQLTYMIALLVGDDSAVAADALYGSTVAALISMSGGDLLSALQAVLSADISSAVGVEPLTASRPTAAPSAKPSEAETSSAEGVSGAAIGGIGAAALVMFGLCAYAALAMTSSRQTISPFDKSTGTGDMELGRRDVQRERADDPNNFFTLPNDEPSAPLQAGMTDPQWARAVTPSDDLGSIFPAQAQSASVLLTPYQVRVLPVAEDKDLY
ncbi:hypothetical protein B484DRAFT_472991, partial [Ochromonadaceae sp. CCMP2298]